MCTFFFFFWTFKKMAEGEKGEEITFKVLFSTSIIDWDVRSSVLPPPGTAGPCPHVGLCYPRLTKIKVRKSPRISSS